MMAQPILINRPIVVTPKGVKLCRPSETVLDILPNPDIGGFVKEDGGSRRAISRGGDFGGRLIVFSWPLRLAADLMAPEPRLWCTRGSRVRKPRTASRATI